MTALYTEFFDFPILQYRLPLRVVIEAVGISLASAAVGALAAVRRAVKLPPAEAMRPEPPADYDVSWVERFGLKRFLSQPARMIWRNLQRHPGRAALSVIGIAAGGALLIVGSFSMDAVVVMLDVQFNVAQRYDMMISFVEPVSARGYHEVRRLPGVIDAEPFRSVPVRLRRGHQVRTTAITGLPANARLNRVVGETRGVVELPPDGLVLSEALAELIGAERGDVVRVEVLEGRRPVRDVIVTDLIDELMGTNAYMNLDALHALMREGDLLSGAYLQVDEAAMGSLHHTLKNTPRVAGVLAKTAALESFNDTMSELVGTVRLINTLFAMIIAFGVVYNSARISLAERSRELATLRVIGFRRTEISYILLGELAIVALVAVPLGLLGGYALAAMTVHAFSNEVYRMPLVIAPATYAFAAITVLVATAVSSLIVRRKLDRLDLVEVLKTRE
jgi:putative ABC transport system permease protein